MSALYHPGKANVVANALTQISIGSFPMFLLVIKSWEKGALIVPFGYSFRRFSKKKESWFVITPNHL